MAPQVAQRIMRHSDYSTTLKHYTVLGISDTRRALEEIVTSVPQREEVAATGTDDGIGKCALSPSLPGASAVAPDLSQAPQLYPQQLQREPMEPGAKRRDQPAAEASDQGPRKSLGSKTPRDSARRNETGKEKAGDRIRTDDVQLGKLAFYH